MHWHAELLMLLISTHSVFSAKKPREHMFEGGAQMLCLQAAVIVKDAVLKVHTCASCSRLFWYNDSNKERSDTMQIASFRQI
jgi:hypothetical protein